MNDARGTFLRSRSDRPDAEPWRVRIGASPPDAREHGDASEPCELPAPTDQGRVYKPPHPILAIAFVYAVSLGLLWGATTGAGDANPRFAVTLAGLLVCLLAAVHWLEGVEPAHVAAKLGAVRAPWRAWWIAVAAALPALGWLLRSTLTASTSTAAAEPGTQFGDWLLRGVTLVVAAAWIEAFFRGFAFRALMRRHGFLVSAGASSLLAAAAVPFVVGAAPAGAHPALTAAFELPLSFALCALLAVYGMALGPALCVRAAVLSAAWWAGSAWPAVAGAAVILVLVRASGTRRSRALHAREPGNGAQPHA